MCPWAPYTPRSIERLHARILERDSLLAAGSNADGTRMSTGQRSAMEARQALFRDAVSSLVTVRPTLPHSEVDGVRVVRVGELDVSVRYLGAWPHARGSGRART